VHCYEQTEGKFIVLERRCCQSELFQSGVVRGRRVA